MSWAVMHALGVNGLNGQPKIKFVLEKAMTDKSQKLKVMRDKNIQTHVYHDCLEVTPCSLRN